MKIVIVQELNKQDVKNEFQCEEYSFTEGTLTLKKNGKPIVYVATNSIKLITIDYDDAPQIQSEAENSQPD